VPAVRKDDVDQARLVRVNVGGTQSLKMAFRNSRPFSFSPMESPF
jgi:hypothetical protein